MNNLRRLAWPRNWLSGQQRQTAASLDALTNELGSDKILNDPRPANHLSTLQAAETEGLSSNSILAYSSADKRARSLVPDDV